MTYLNGVGVGCPAIYEMASSLGCRRHSTCRGFGVAGRSSLSPWNVLAAAGFLVFVAGEALVLSGTAMTLEASAPSFAAGVSLWAASLALVGASNTMPAGHGPSELS